MLILLEGNKDNKSFNRKDNGMTFPLLYSTYLSEYKRMIGAISNKVWMQFKSTIETLLTPPSKNISLMSGIASRKSSGTT